MLLLTEVGQKVKSKYLSLTRHNAEVWRQKFGEEQVRELRSSLVVLCGDGGSQSPLFQALTPYPDNWRSEVKRPKTLPHFPMVLHRGGYPDGS
jgi:hypothetical protein